MNHFLKEGVVFIDKPSGVSSHAVVNWARKVSGVKRIGHTGTLDPLATGLLVLLIGRQYTKMQKLYLKKDKEYICLARLGIVTDTYDISGQVIHETIYESVKKTTKHDLETVLRKFIGVSNQTVPIFSAVKMSGRKLYAIARQAKNEGKIISELKVELPVRSVEIYSIELCDFIVNSAQNNTEFKIKVRCSSGTYIRSLIHDIGKMLGVGATLIALQRTKIGEWSIEFAEYCPLFINTKSLISPVYQNKL